jgi:hypothetical protein
MIFILLNHFISLTNFFEPIIRFIHAMIVLFKSIISLNKKVM